MTTPPGELGFADAMVRLSHLVQHVFTDVSRDYDLTPQQAQLLCILISGPLGMTELGRLLHLEKSSMSGLVDRVERRGLVTRTRDSRDRRACRIELTSQGVQLAVTSHEAVTARLERLAGELRPPERAAVVSAVGQLLAAQRTTNGHVAAPGR